MFGVVTLPGFTQTPPYPTNLCFSLVPPTFSNTITQQNCTTKTYPFVLNLRASLSNPCFPLGSKIMVRNLGYSISESSLQKEFANFGEIAEVKLVKDEAAKRSNAYAFIQYSSVDDAILALENMDHKIFGGRMIYVELAKPGKRSFGWYPKASGPPKSQNLQGKNDLPDCWY